MSKRALKHKPYLKLKGVLAEKALTQKDIADLLLLSPVTINQKINGTLDFSYSEVETICNYLEVSSEIFRTQKVA
jgi:DNA-binding XRE family transcriptional regulator